MILHNSALLSLEFHRLIFQFWPHDCPKKMIMCAAKVDMLENFEIGPDLFKGPAAGLAAVTATGAAIAAGTRGAAGAGLAAVTAATEDGKEATDRDEEKRRRVSTEDSRGLH